MSCRREHHARRSTATRDGGAREARGERADPLTMTIEQFRLAGLATGLTALLGELDPATSSPLSDDASIQAHITSSASRCASAWSGPGIEGTGRRRPRRRRCPGRLRQGCGLIDGVWSHPSAAPDGRSRRGRGTAPAGAGRPALVAAGCTWWTSTRTRTRSSAGETAARAGWTASRRTTTGASRSIPGWLEFVHGYEVAGFDVIGAARPTDGRLRLPLDALTAQVVGHLGATVVRAEVRALNAVDTLFCDRRGVDWQDVSRLLHQADPRLAAPGLWLVDRLLPGMIPGAVVTAHMRRLPAPARALLDDTSRSVVFGIRRHGPISGGDRRSPSAPRTLPGRRTDGVDQPRRSIGATVERLPHAAWAPGWRRDRATAAHRRRDAAGPPVGTGRSARRDADLAVRWTHSRRWTPSTSPPASARSDAAVIEHDGSVHRFEPSDRRSFTVRDLDPTWCPCTVWASSLRCRSPLPSLDRHIAIVVQHHGEPPGPWRNRQLHRLVRRHVDGYCSPAPTTGGPTVPRRRGARTTVPRLRRVGGRQHPASRACPARGQTPADMLLEGGTRRSCGSAV